MLLLTQKRMLHSFLSLTHLLSSGLFQQYLYLKKKKKERNLKEEG